MTYEEAYLAPEQRPQGVILPAVSATDRKIVPWTVYGIAEEGHEDDPFYIGITNNIKRRLQQHNYGDTAVQDRVSQLEAAGIDCILFPIRAFDNRKQAAAYEATLIALRPQMTNKLCPRKALQ